MRFLGLIEDLRPDKNNDLFALILPILQFTSTGFKYVEKSEFPTRGKVVWFKCESVERGRILYFDIEELEKPGIDLYFAKNVNFAFEVIDMSSYGDTEKVRLIIQSSKINEHPMPKDDFILCKDGVVGPITFLFNESQQHWILTEKHELLEVRDVNDIMDLAIAFETNGITRAVIKEGGLSPLVRHVDWSPDSVILTKLFSKVKKSSNYTRAQRQELTARLRETLEMQPDDDDLQELTDYRRSRALALVDKISFNQTDLDEIIVPTLLGLPEVKAKIEQERIKVIEHERQAIQGQIQTEFKTQQKEIETLTTERASLEAFIEEGRRALAETNSQLQLLDATIRQGVRDAVERPATLLSEVALLRPLLIGGQKENLSDGQIIPMEWPDSAPLIKDKAEFQRRLMVAGFKGETRKRLLSALCAGLTPIFTGPRALPALQSFARSTMNSRVIVTRVSPGMLEPTDLFGKVDPGTGRFVPHRSRVLNLFEAALEHPDQLALLILEGVNRAPAESLFWPLLQSANQILPIQLFHAEGVISQDPRAHQASIAWPKNVLLAATILDGATTLPMTSDVWAYSVLIDSSGYVEPTGEIQEANVPVSTLKPAIPPVDAGVLESVVEDMLDGVGVRDLLAAFETTIHKFGSALMSQGVTNEKDLRSALDECLVLPILTCLDIERDQEGASAAELRLRRVLR